MIKRQLLFLLLAVIASVSQAQDRSVQMADNMRSNGKIYVVVVVILTIFAGIVLYLIRLDRKIAKLEKNNNNY